MSHSPDHSVASAKDAGDVVSSDAEAWISYPQICVHSSPPDGNAINGLIDSEHHHMPRPDYLSRCWDRSIDLTARQDSINWILKIYARFKTNIALYECVQMGGRFSCYRWRLSLAAKMEETYVPLLLDLQVFEPKFVFEPRTVQRMELWVMANLNWRLRSVTPFDYLDYFICKLPSSGSKPDLGPILSSSSDLILNIIRVIDFLGFPPSTIAAAAVLSVAGKSIELPDNFYNRANKEMVRSGHQLMEEYLVSWWTRVLRLAIKTGQTSRCHSLVQLVCWTRRCVGAATRVPKIQYLVPVTGQVKPSAGTSGLDLLSQMYSNSNRR